ncbi:MAG: hypothetical protein JWR74_1906 [Polaromonas sp.]|jgi:hypothetical protein|nr:hypothetical protein [Polaromonas sp.]
MRLPRPLPQQRRRLPWQPPPDAGLIFQEGCFAATPPLILVCHSAGRVPSVIEHAVLLFDNRWPPRHVRKG